MGLLDDSRTAIPLIPERLIAQAARERDVDLAAVEHAHEDGGMPLVQLDPIMRTVIADALRRLVLTIPQWVRLSFTMQHQQQTNWCWAATSVSVSHFYTATSRWTQCEMVNQELGQTTCCTNGSSSQCNQGHVLDAPLRRAGVLDHMVSGTVSYAIVGGEIDGGRPLPIRIGWRGGGGHFIAIDGYLRGGTQWVAVGDPWYGSSDVTVSSLTGGTYQGSGSWTHTYFTRRPLLLHFPPRVPIRFPLRTWERVRAEHLELAKGGPR